MGHLSYLGTILIFAGLALLLEVVLIGKALRQHSRIVGIVVIIFLVGSISEHLALATHAWGYYPRHILNLRIFGAELESYIFSASTAAAVAIPTCILASREERNEPFPTFRSIAQGLRAKLYRKKAKT